MFHNIYSNLLKRMQYLEEIDRRDRVDGTPRQRRLRQITPDTGRFLALMAANTPDGSILEVGTSAGYSTLWLALAAEALGRKITTFELFPGKLKLAEETFQAAAVEDTVRLIAGDARNHLSDYDRIAFCFLDAEKDIYLECYELVVPRLVSGGILVADNVISHQLELQPMLQRAQSDERVDSLVVPIGRGELVCRKI